MDTILNSLNNTIFQQSFFWQTLNVVACLIIADVLHRVNNKFFFSKIFSERVKKRIVISDVLRNIFHSFAYPLIYPLFIVIILTIGLSIHSQFWSDGVIILSTIKIVILLAFLKLLRRITLNDFVVNMVGVFLISALILSAFNILGPTVTYLDKLSFSFGEVRISIYLVIRAFVILAFVFWVSGLVGKNSKRFFEKKTNILPSTKTIIAKVIDITIYFFIFIITLKTFGVDLTALAVLGGAVGVGIGFGLQKIASNFISGIILLFEKSIETGDIIEIDGAIYGTVKRFSGRYTLIQCFDGKEIMMPNEEFIVSRVTNWTFSDKRARIRLSIGVAYSSDLEKVREIMLKCAYDHPRTIKNDKDAEIGCYLKEFGDSSVNFDLYFWVNDINEGLFGPKNDVYMAIWKEFKNNNISIPFPQREVKILKE